MMYGGGMATLDNLRKDRLMLRNILWDIEPKELMEPRCGISQEGAQEKKVIHGYIFYIDKITAKKPTLYLMYHTKSSYAETVAKIDEVPDEMIQEAMDNNKDKEYFGMIPINKRIKDWLKKELAIED